MNKFLELAERCEAATGPDRELDVLLAYEAGIIHSGDGHNLYYGKHQDYVLERGYCDHGGNPDELPYYTASLDAAMTLADDADIAELLNDAIEAVGKRGWTVGDYRGALTRTFVAEYLRARAAQ